VTFTGLVVLMRPDLKEAIGIARGADSPYDPDPLREHLTAGMTILSEDPGVAALRGETPVVFDPFMIRRIADRKPELVDDLVRRIEAQEFDRLVLVVPLENDEIWWRDYHFGEELVSAMRASYAVEATVAGYHLYRPSG
jgi:hypothetical protein